MVKIGGGFYFLFWHLQYNSDPGVNADDGILMPVYYKSDGNCCSKQALHVPRQGFNTYYIS